MAGEAIVKMRSRLEAVPTQLISWAWGYSDKKASFEEVLIRAEKMRDYKEQASSPSWPTDWQPFLTAEQTRIIYEALSEYETAVDSDVIVLRSLCEWFGPDKEENK